MDAPAAPLNASQTEKASETRLSQLWTRVWLVEVSLGMVGGRMVDIGGGDGVGGEGGDEGGGGVGEDWLRGFGARPRRRRASGSSKVGKSELFSEAEAERVRWGGWSRSRMIRRDLRDLGRIDDWEW